MSSSTTSENKPTSKTCSICKTEKPMSDFPSVGKQCKECKRARGKANALKKREALLRDPNATKTCKKCNEEKHPSEFRIQRNQCLDCERSDGRSYRSSDHGRAKSKAWIDNNRERFSELQHNNYEKNKPEIRRKYRERYASDANFRRERNYRSSVNKLLRSTQKTNRYVGCTRMRLHNWIEFQFNEGMTLENYPDQWVPDHVIPLGLGSDGTYSFELLAQWFNITPVHPKYNLSKNKHMDPEQIALHLETYRSYCRIRRIEINQEYLSLLEQHSASSEQPQKDQASS